MKSKPPKGQLPASRKAQPLERVPTPIVLPPAKTQHTNINVEAHLVIREVRYLIVALVLLTLFVVGAAFGS